ncbi:MAG TPA: AraC family transcriptional regulator, partial [Chloroflexota bacterium]|nr:AraC family transcriptional regulator [Chloroflexota bacterium]
MPHTEPTPLAAATDVIHTPALEDLPQGSVRVPRQDASDAAGSLLAAARCTVHSAGWYRFSAEWHLPERVVPNHILFFGIGGEATVSLGTERYALHPGHILLTPPHLPHSIRHHPRRPLQLLTVHFTARLYGVLDVPAFFGFPTRLSPAAPTWRALAATARRIIAELSRGLPGCALAVNGDAMRLLALLWRESLAQGAAAPGLRQPAHLAQVERLAPVFRLIQARYAERLTLHDLAGAAHLHPAYFATVFRRVAGVAPLHYVARYRLDRVRDLLLSTDLSIAEIAQRTGFGDAYYLSRVFRRTAGMSPRSFR